MAGKFIGFNPQLRHGDPKCSFVQSRRNETCEQQMQKVWICRVSTLKFSLETPNLTFHSEAMSRAEKIIREWL
jgi:hypothetical protein